MSQVSVARLNTFKQLLLLVISHSIDSISQYKIQADFTVLR